MDFDDISCDDRADLPYDVAAHVVRHFRGYLSEEETSGVEPKAKNEMHDADVLAKRDAAVTWCSPQPHAGASGPLHTPCAQTYALP
jgi:hypothetical protein